jgi:hypothetical protein
VDKVAGTGEPVQYSDASRAVDKGAGQNSWPRTAETGQLGEESQGRPARKGQLRQESRDRQPGKDSRDSTFG